MPRSIRPFVLAAFVVGLLPLSFPACSKTVKPVKHHHVKPRVEAAAQTDADPDGHNTWQQNTALLSQLAPEDDVQEFSIRPPLGYNFNQDSKERDVDTVFIYDWSGVSRSDGSAPELQMQLTKLKPDSVAIGAMDDRMDDLFKDMKKDAPWIQESPYQHGLINDMSFVRSYFKDGPGAPAGQPINHGFVYKTTSNDGKYLITIIAHDTEPNNTTTLPLLEASVLTLKQK